MRNEPVCQYFGNVKEDVGWYFVEYQRSIDSACFATSNLVVPDETDKSKIVQKMEIEMHGWFERYPMPLLPHMTLYWGWEHDFHS
jgi:hypothetical protein